MATMISEVYDGFIASGAPKDKARKAAEAIAAYEGRSNKIENDLSILKWMNGVGPERPFRSLDGQGRGPFASLDDYLKAAV